jgi:ankyrin repeat protein
MLNNKLGSIVDQLSFALQNQRSTSILSKDFIRKVSWKNIHIHHLAAYILLQGFSFQTVQNLGLINEYPFTSNAFYNQPHSYLSPQSKATREAIQLLAKALEIAATYPRLRNDNHNPESDFALYWACQTQNHFLLDTLLDSRRSHFCPPSPSTLHSCLMISLQSLNRAQIQKLISFPHTPKSLNNYAALRLCIALPLLHDLLPSFLPQPGPVPSGLHESLWIACANGCLETVKQLLAVGADASYNSSFSLRLAASNGHMHIVRYLIDTVSNIQMASNRNEVLERSVAAGDEDIVVRLIQKDAVKRGSFLSAIWVGVLHERVKIVEVLLECEGGEDSREKERLVVWAVLEHGKVGLFWRLIFKLARKRVEVAELLAFSILLVAILLGFVTLKFVKVN